MSAASSDRLRRILVLVPWVMAHPDALVAETCDRFGLSRDELAADLDLLFVCGLPPFGPGDLIEAYIDEERVVIRMADYLARPPRLTRDEAVALLAMGHAMAALPGLEEAESLRSALGKLSATVTPSESQHAQDVARRIEIDLSSAGSELLTVLRRGVVDHERLRLTYFSASRGEMSDRDVEPLLVFHAMGNWYLVARDVAGGEEKHFRVDRIKECAPTGTRFTPPAGFDPGRFADAPPYAPSGREQTVSIDIAPEATWMREVIPSGRETGIERGWIRLEIRTAHFAWLVRLLLSAGPHARAHHPPELARAVRDAARAALAGYSGT